MAKSAGSGSGTPTMTTPATRTTAAGPTRSASASSGKFEAQLSFRKRAPRGARLLFSVCCFGFVAMAILAASFTKGSAGGQTRLQVLQGPRRDGDPRPARDEVEDVHRGGQRVRRGAQFAGRSSRA